MHAIQVSEYGGSEALQYVEVPMPEPKAGEVHVKITAVGVNYIDVYHRTGQYPSPRPFIPGREAAGIVDAVGAGVTDLNVGDHVAYALVPGAYAEYAVVPADKLVQPPAGVDDRSAAAAMLQGITAQYLSHTTYAIQKGDTVLIHAGAGGVGLLLIQMAKRLGGRVLTTVSTEEKANLAREAGADEVILYTQTDFEAEVRRLTAGAGVAAVYDSVGKTTFDKSLNCLRPLGSMVLFGASSGPVPPFDPNVLQWKGSLFLTRPTMGNYVATRQALLERASTVLGWVADGSLKLRLQYTYPLAEAAQAHRDLEARKTTGKLLLIP